MKIWLDAHLSPGVAAWINESFDDLRASSLRALELQHASDREIFTRAKAEGVIFVTKDADFVHLVERHGPPPQLLLLHCGNTSNAQLRSLLGVHLQTAIEQFAQGETILEIA